MGEKQASGEVAAIRRYYHNELSKLKASNFSLALKVKRLQEEIKLLTAENEQLVKYNKRVEWFINLYKDTLRPFEELEKENKKLKAENKQLEYDLERERDRVYMSKHLPL
jgi:cell division protein FtsB